MDPAVRAALFVRTAGYCDWCGRPMEEDAMAAHHRKRVSQGGTWALSNLAGCHHMCHNGFTDAIHLAPLKAREAGFLVPVWHDPRLVPLLLHGARWVTLHDDGTVNDVPEED